MLEKLQLCIITPATGFLQYQFSRLEGIIILQVSLGISVTVNKTYKKYLVKSAAQENWDFYLTWIQIWFALDFLSRSQQGWEVEK